MEKFIRNLSTVITSLLIYTIGAYTYMSFKGFEIQDGKIVLIQAANAEPLTEDVDNGFATRLDDNLVLNLSNVETVGDENAPLTLYEFSSLGCTHCASFHLNTLPKLKKDFVETGKLKVVFVNFPLERKSMQGAMLSSCIPAENREKFLNMLFEKQREWGLSYNPEKMFLNYALVNGLSKTDAEACLKNDRLAEAIIANRQEGIEKLKMQGTPAFLISGNQQNEIIYGAPDYDTLKTYLEQRLSY